MRAVWVLGALLVVPFVASLSQERPDRDSRTLQSRDPSSERADRSERGKHCSRFAARADRDEDESDDRDIDHKRQCGSQAPPPPPSPSCGPTISGTASISGTVANTTGGVSGVCVQALLSGAVVAGAATDGSGNYTVSVLASGEMFMVCAIAPAGSTQVFPSIGLGLPLCPSGNPGYQFGLLAGAVAQLVNFSLQ